MLEASGQVNFATAFTTGGFLANLNRSMIKTSDLQDGEASTQYEN